MPFDDEEYFDDEWVDVYDSSGKKASLRHLATVRCHEKTYMILGSLEMGADERNALMLVREDHTVDGATEYVVANDKNEIESVIGQFVMRMLLDHMDDLPSELAQAMEDLMPPTDFAEDKCCTCSHQPGEFCFCDNPLYLQ